MTQISDDERDKQMAENTDRLTSQGSAEGQKRLDDATGGKRWFHAWVSSRLIRAQVTNKPGSDTLHESIMVYQGGKRLTVTTAVGRGGYRVYGKVKKRPKEAYTDETVCDFKLVSAEPVFINFCFVNMAAQDDAARQTVEDLNYNLFQGLVRQAINEPTFSLDRLGQVADAVAKAIKTIGSQGLISVATVHSIVGVILSLVTHNQNGPVAFASLCIKDPANMLPKANTHESPVEEVKVRCEHFSESSDYEVFCHVKPMNKEDCDRMLAA